MTTPQSPTLDELRDWHYRRKALADIGKPFSEMPWAEQHWDTDFMRRVDSKPWLLHPFPATLDGAASAMPEGWDWWRGEEGWIAIGHNSNDVLAVYVDDTGNEIYDRYLLAKLAWQKETGK